MGCNCGKPATPPSTKYVVTGKNGDTYEVDSEAEARIKAVMVGGRWTVKRK